MNTNFQNPSLLFLVHLSSVINKSICFCTVLVNLGDFKFPSFLNISLVEHTEIEGHPTLLHIMYIILYSYMFVARSRSLPTYTSTVVNKVMLLKFIPPYYTYCTLYSYMFVARSRSLPTRGCCCCCCCCYLVC